MFCQFSEVIVKFLWRDMFVDEYRNAASIVFPLRNFCTGELIMETQWIKNGDAKILVSLWDNILLAQKEGIFIINN